MSKKIGKTLVAGAGISGIRAALDLAERGYGVMLVDRASHIGGILSQLDYQFPTNHCGMCRMLPLIQRDASSQFCLRKGLFHENIDILLNTEIVGIDGESGHFTVSLRRKPTWVDPERCTGCGVCSDVCPVEVPDAFNEGLSLRKAIYLPVPHTVPNPYVIDLAACTHCGECEKACPTDAIILPADKTKEFRILVVDDEAVMRDSLKEWLEDEGFFVSTAESGPAALEALAADTCHLMLTDIKMPGMDGVELLKAAREISPELCVLMMTAYATVDTAVDAMKLGASDYLVKPFDPEKLIPMVAQVYENMEAAGYQQIEAASIVLCCGTDYADPSDEKNVYAYGVNPNVVTSIEFERLLSHSGPVGGRLVRPGDGRALKKIAWFQCVGSRDIQKNADFCSSICCMYAVKEAMLAKDIGGDELDAAIFYMDMRTFGKSFERYRDEAEQERGIRFERARIHSIMTDAESGDPVIRYVRPDGTCLEETFDLVVLAVGQRPAPGTAQLAEMAEIDLNQWGFPATLPFSPAETQKSGVAVGGSFSGLRDISESVVFASAASLEASRTIHAAGGSLAVEDEAEKAFRDVSHELPSVLVAICTCGNRFAELMDVDNLSLRLTRDPYVQQVVYLEQTCTTDGWEKLAEAASESSPNRIVIGACHPYLYIRKLRELADRIRLDPVLMDVVDIMTPLIKQADTLSPQRVVDDQVASLEMAISKIKHIDTPPLRKLAVTRSALVVGGGIGGLQASLAIADHGYPVDLVETADRLGGNLNWLTTTIEGNPMQSFFDDTLQKVEKHPKINIHLNTTVTNSFGEVGGFHTILENCDGRAKTVEHGAVILATGGREAETASYAFGQSERIVTQKKMETLLAGDDGDIQALRSVVMIQCVDSREEPRNYCSRVCCPTALKHALKLKEKNPDVSIYILYRDIMTPGFTETYYTQARQAGVLFFEYEVNNKPRVSVSEQNTGVVSVTAVDPVLGRPVEIEADLLVLATGIVPELPADLASTFGADVDRDGFFKEADSKWRPVDGLKEGVFACGLALSPRSVVESVATAFAAAQRALRILSHAKLPAGRVVAEVRDSLCSLCERCIDACPYSARTIDTQREKVVVNPVMCQGCGICATVCPNSAAVVMGFNGQQMLNMIDAAIEAADSY